MAQAITGIPWYYRQFGYEMTVDLDGQRQYRLKRTPEKKAAADEPYRLRPATVADIPFLQTLYDAQRARSLLSRVRDEALWRYEMAETCRESAYARHVFVLETAVSPQPVAYIEYKQFQQIFSVREVGVADGRSWRDIGLFLLRHFQREADRLDKKLPKPVETVFFYLGDGHRLYGALLRELHKTPAIPAVNY